MKDLKVDGVSWNELDLSTKIKAIIVASSIVLIPLMIISILISSTNMFNKIIAIIIGVFFFKGVTITRTKNE